MSAISRPIWNLASIVKVSALLKLMEMMMNKEQKPIIHSGWSGFWVTIGLWVIFFWGEPDLRQALIDFLMANKYD